MKLTVLGSGTLVSGPERATTGFALEIGGQPIVVDLGFGCFKNMQRAGIDFSKVNNLFFTHFEHPDHVNDLSAFIFARKGLIDLGYGSPVQVNIFGGSGFKGFVETLLDAYPSLKKLPFKLTASDLEPYGSKKFGEFSLKTKPMSHAPSSIGMRFEAGRKSVVFSGDTEANENLVELSKGADLLVLECNYGKEPPKFSHLNAEIAGGIAARAKAKAILLSHLLPETEKQDLKKIAAKKFSGKILLAKDLLEVNV
ncbi:MAG: ribonuclease Z [Candidatus Diapherotrites archaeon]|nr:ribonuclease Z [Candidatus Diapherotrites archaeon]